MYFVIKKLRRFPGNIYLFKVNNRNTRKRFQICWKLTKKNKQQKDEQVNVSWVCINSALVQNRICKAWYETFFQNDTSFFF